MTSHLKEVHEAIKRAWPNMTRAERREWLPLMGDFFRPYLRTTERLKDVPEMNADKWLQILDDAKKWREQNSRHKYDTTSSASASDRVKQQPSENKSNTEVKN